MATEFPVPEEAPIKEFNLCNIIIFVKVEKNYFMLYSYMVSSPRGSSYLGI